jgi:hypothetical protein
MTMHDVFISYKREEQNKARMLANALESKGWSIWWDPNLRTGEDFDDVIEEVITNVKCVIVLKDTKDVRRQQCTNIPVHGAPVFPRSTGSSVATEIRSPFCDL